MKVPAEFQAPIKVEYPPDNKEIFEQWLIHNIGEYPCDRIYLPINWTGYFVNHRYGADRGAMSRLQRYLNSLDRSKKYWTVTQYDLGIIVPIEHIDIKVYGSGGGRIDFPIPLICQPHGKLTGPKTINYSFIGSLTHPIRDLMVQACKDLHYVPNHVPINEFCRVLQQSKFVLCPRGFGLTSFRICEALEQQSIPVYVSDKFIIPGHKDFEEYGVLIDQSQIPDIDRILRSITPEQIESKRKAGERIYQEMYTFEGCKNLILNNL